MAREGEGPRQRSWGQVRVSHKPCPLQDPGVPKDDRCGKDPGTWGGG